MAIAWLWTEAQDEGAYALLCFQTYMTWSYIGARLQYSVLQALELSVPFLAIPSY
jgi:hypothetical protein